MNGMVIVDDGRVALLSITRQTMTDLGGTNDDLEGLINFPLTVKDIEAVAFFKEVGDHDWRVSLRSKGTVDIGAIARQFTRRRPHERRRLLRRRATSTPCTSSSARCSTEAVRNKLRPDPDRRSPFPDGVLVVDKTEGPTSHDVVTLARRALGVSRIGHTGTLDPMATGVLPLVIGRATRLAQFLTASDKTYEATIAFGRTTDTYDASGTIATTCDRRPTRDQLDVGARRSFAARSNRRRRRFPRRTSTASARTSSRAGGKAERPTHACAEGRVGDASKRLEILSFDGETARLEMQVTAGFYVRSLAHDLGAALGCGARPGGAAADAVRRVRTRPCGPAGRRAAVAARIARGAAGAVPGPAARLAVGHAARSRPTLERLKNGVEMAPERPRGAPGGACRHIVRLLGPDGRSGGPGETGQNAGLSPWLGGPGT